MNCQNLKQKYQELLTLQADFQAVNAEFQKMKLSTIAERRAMANQLLELQNNIQNLIDTEFSHLLDFKFNETQKTLKEQYKNIKNILLNNDLITEKGSKNPFPDLIPETQEYFPFPTEKQIRAELNNPEKKEFYELKIKQGFTRIEIVPIIPLKHQIDALAKVVLKHKNNLFVAKKNPNEETVELIVADEDNPVGVNGYLDNNPDLIGDIVYYPGAFVFEGNEGATKEELLLESLETPFPGYVVELKQESPLILKYDEAEILHNRRNLQTYISSWNYLEEIREGEEYRGESLVTIDSIVIEVINHLENGNGILRYWASKNDAACIAPGTYIKSYDHVPILAWTKTGQFVFESRESDDYDSDEGSCTSVILGMD